MLNVCSVCFVPPGKHDIRSGGERHAGREGRQEGVHRLVNQDADHRCRQEDHPGRNTQPPFCHYVSSPWFPAQHTVRAQQALLLLLFIELSFWTSATVIRHSAHASSVSLTLSVRAVWSRASKIWRSVSVASTCTTQSTRARHPLSPMWPPAPPPTSLWPSTTSWTLCTAR